MFLNSSADMHSSMEEPPCVELMINRFNRLVKEILQGEVRRTTFQPWEVDFLVDLQSCSLTKSRREEALGRYQRVVQKQLERGQLPPMRFSEFLVQRRKPAVLPAGSSADHAPPLHA